jgi:hypothetical protein
VALAFARPVELPSGPHQAVFHVARTDPEHTPGTWLFVCQHRTPEVTWRADYIEQPNGAQGIAEVAGIAADLQSVSDAYGLILPGRVRCDRECVVIDAGSAWITFWRQAAFVERFAPFGEQLSAAAPRLAALRLRTGSLERTQAILNANGVRHMATAQGTIVVAPDEACGTIFEFAPS